VSSREKKRDVRERKREIERGVAAGERKRGGLLPCPSTHGQARGLAVAQSATTHPRRRRRRLGVC